jgi:Glycosyltransferase
MKILMVNKFLYPKGGAELYMFKLGNQLKALGNMVEYFGMQDEKNIVGNNANSYAPNIDYHKQNKKRVKLALSTIHSRESCRQIAEVLDTFSPDVVHLNNINFQITPAIIYEIGKRNIPVVQTVHDVQIACPCHRFYIDHKQQICEECNGGKYWKCVKNKCLQNSFLKSIVAAIESYYYHTRKTYNMVDMYICPSKFITQQIIRAGIDEKKAVIMQNFGDDTIAEIIKEKSPKYVLYFGRLSHEKGIKTLLDVFKNNNDIDIKIAGSGPLEEEVKRVANSNSNITYIGFKTGSELRKIIQNAQFSLCTSECHENSPLSILESEALGTPVVTSELGGLKELVEEGETGRVFKAGDKEQLTLVVRQLWEDEAAIKQMSENCLKKKLYKISTYAEDILNQYKKVIQMKERSNRNVK